MKLPGYRVPALILALASLLPTPAMATEAKIPRAPIQQIWARTEIYFGANRPGGAVSDLQFMHFLDHEIAPRFPKGLTLLTGYGQSRTLRGSMEKERSRVLILLYPLDSPDANKHIQEIREIYKARFRQDSVLRVDSYALISF